jgi:hypothetical protein
MLFHELVIIIITLCCPCQTFTSTRSVEKLHLTHGSKKFRPIEALIPLEVEEMKRLLTTGAPTAAQYSTYWGRNSKEQYAKWNESALVMLLGTFLSYCLSFVFGSFISTLLGVVCATWAILGPEFQAYQRNWELLGGRSIVDPWSVDGDEENQGLYGALFLGKVADVAVVEDADSLVEYDILDFNDYTMENDPLEQLTGIPYLLRVKFHDSSGRTLQVHARLSEEYLELKANQLAAGILLSTSPKFTSLAALTDFVIPGAQCWIGDYPYLNRAEMEYLLTEDDTISSVFQHENNFEFPSDSVEGENTSEMDSNYLHNRWQT